MSDARTIYEVEVRAVVRIAVNHDYDPPADLFTRAETDEFKSALYGDAVSDQKTVLQHWAYNAVVNGVSSPHRLDGWGDLASDAVDLFVVEAEATRVLSPGDRSES